MVANIAQSDNGSTREGSERPNITGTRMTRLGFDGDDGNNVELDKVNYAFNLSDAIRVKIDATGAEFYETGVDVFNPDFKSSGSGAISRYGRFSPIYRQGSGGAGVTVQFNPNGPLSLSAAYLSPRASNPTEGNGVIDGGNAIFGQVAFKPSKAFNIGLTYARTYQNSESGVNLFGSTGSGIANNPFGGVATTSDNYGVQATFNPSSALTIGGWAGYTTAQSQVSDADADIFYWAASVGVKDFGREGNVLGLIFGQPPKVTGGSVGEEDGTSYHLEGLYKMRLTDNIAVTPGLLVIFNPEHRDNADTVYVGTLRTTFSF